MFNVISLLKEDHQRISGLFDLFAESDRLSEKLALFQQIKDELELHTFLEEKIFYPALSKFYELSDLIDSSYEEHDEMGDLADEIDQMEPDTEDLENSEEGEASSDSSKTTAHDHYNDAIEELRLMFQRHVDNEEREVFPEARDLLDPESLEKMASDMNELRSLNRVA